jgi:hypothetical protein
LCICAYIRGVCMIISKLIILIQIQEAGSNLISRCAAPSFIHHPDYYLK